MKKNHFPFLFAITFATAGLTMETPFEQHDTISSLQEIASFDGFQVIEETDIGSGEYAMMKAEEDLKILFERARKAPDTVALQELRKFFCDETYKNMDEGVYYYTMIESIITKEISRIANVMSSPNNTPEQKREFLKDFKAYTHISKIFLDRLNSHMELKAIF